MTITPTQQEAISALLAAQPERRLLLLLTLRGNSEYMGLRRLVGSGEIGTPSFVHVRMAVQLKRAQRPEWFLDVHRSGGLFPAPPYDDGGQTFLDPLNLQSAMPTAVRDKE